MQPKEKPKISPLIKVGLTTLEKSENAVFKARLHRTLGEELDPITNQPISKRNEDLFIGGPSWIDGTTCTHAPNGPRAFNDAKGNWADYYIKDRVQLVEFGSKVAGYHVYSTARSLHGSENFIERKHQPELGFNTRGPNMRKCYYYCGFLSEALLLHDGIYPGEFSGIYTV